MMMMIMTTTVDKNNFHSFQYLGDSPSNNNLFNLCDYCGQYRKIHVLNHPIYYRKGLKRKLVSYCNDCYPAIITAKDLHVADWKPYGYFEILSVVKNSTIAAGAAATTTVNFDDAVRKAYSMNGNLKQYLDSFSRGNDTLLFDNKRVWEFRYKMQYEEPRVKVIQQDPLIILWKG
jgi:hypothetical protein